jgi:hypothetical protein
MIFRKNPRAMLQHTDVPEGALSQAHNEFLSPLATNAQKRRASVSPNRNAIFFGLTVFENASP